MTIAAAVSSGLATLRELQQDYSCRDLYDILEMAAVRADNEATAQAEMEREMNERR